MGLIHFTLVQHPNAGPCIKSLCVARLVKSIDFAQKVAVRKFRWEGKFFQEIGLQVSQFPDICIENIVLVISVGGPLQDTLVLYCGSNRERVEVGGRLAW